MRYAARSDHNQQEIIDALRDAGASVHSLHRVGQGCPDLLIGHMGFTYLMEVKDNGGRLTFAERKFIDTWRGNDVAIVYSVEDALNVIGARVGA